MDQEIQSINYVGVAYRNLSNFSKAFEKYLEALKLSEEAGNGEQRGYSLINLGNLYLYQTNFHGAIKYFIFRHSDQAQSLADKRMVAYCFLNLGGSYKGIAEYGQAELYFKQAIEIRKEQGDLYGQLASEIDLIEVYLLQGDLRKSEQYHLSLIQRLEEMDNPRMLAVVYNNIAKIYLSRNELKKQKGMLTKLLRVREILTPDLKRRMFGRTLSKIYANGDNFERAFESHVKYAELNQQLFSEENIRKIEQLKGQYEMEQQEVENEFLRKQSELNEQVIRTQRIMITVSVIGILLFLTMTIISVRGYLVKRNYPTKSVSSGTRLAVTRSSYSSNQIN